MRKVPNANASALATAKKTSDKKTTRETCRTPRARQVAAGWVLSATLTLALGGCSDPEMKFRSRSFAGATDATGAPGATMTTSAANTAFPPHALQQPHPKPVLLCVAPLSQKPELQNGCEVTSLAMLLTAVNRPVDKMTLAKMQPQDPTPLVRDKSGKILKWGNPNRGFVGKVDGYGYGLYHEPAVSLLNHIVPGQAVDLTGQPFSVLTQTVDRGVPVVVWTTATFHPTLSWVTWESPDGPVRATFQEHAVLLVGYDPHFVYVNDPLTGKAAQRLNRSSFIAAWRQLGRQAVTLKRLPVNGSSGEQRVQPEVSPGARIPDA